MQLNLTRQIYIYTLFYRLTVVIQGKAKTLFGRRIYDKMTINLSLFKFQKMNCDHMCESVWHLSIKTNTLFVKDL